MFNLFYLLLGSSLNIVEVARKAKSIFGIPQTQWGESITTEAPTITIPTKDECRLKWQITDVLEILKRLVGLSLRLRNDDVTGFILFFQVLLDLAHDRLGIAIFRQEQIVLKQAQTIVVQRAHLRCIGMGGGICNFDV